MKILATLSLLSASVAMVEASTHGNCYKGALARGDAEVDKAALTECLHHMRNGQWVNEEMDSMCGDRRWYSGAKGWKSPNRCHDECNDCIFDAIQAGHGSVSCVLVNSGIFSSGSCWVHML